MEKSSLEESFKDKNLKIPLIISTICKQMQNLITESSVNIRTSGGLMCFGDGFYSRSIFAIKTENH